MSNQVFWLYGASAVTSAGIESIALMVYDACRPARDSELLWPSLSRFRTLVGHVSFGLCLAGLIAATVMPE